MIDDPPPTHTHTHIYIYISSTIVQVEDRRTDGDTVFGRGGDVDVVVTDRVVGIGGGPTFLQEGEHIVVPGFRQLPNHAVHAGANQRLDDLVTQDRVGMVAHLRSCRWWKKYLYRMTMKGIEQRSKTKELV